jgi:hypothetical protein
VTAALYLDEDVVPELARVLRGHGHDVVSAHERGRQGVSDEAQLAYATAEDRALLTFNYPDFLRLGQEWFFAERAHAGIVVSYRQYGRNQLGELARAVVALLTDVPAEDLRNTVRVLDAFI